MNYSKYGCDCDRCNPQREQEETPAVPSEVTQETLNKIDISIHNGVLNALISKQRTLSERFTRLNMQLKELEQINKELADRAGAGSRRGTTRFMGELWAEGPKPKEKKVKEPQESGEDQFYREVTEAGLPVPERQYQGVTGRKFRFDFCWPELHLVAEIQGGTWGGGRHTTGAGYQNDCIRQCLAQLQDWIIYPFTTSMVRSGQALNFITEAIRKNESKFQKSF